MKAKQIQKITKNMLIAEILAENPEKAQLLSEIMIDFGIHCVGCGASSFETLEQGVLGHGYSEDDLNKLVKQINELLEENSKSTGPKNIKNFSLNFTKTAIEKIKQIMKQEKRKNAILRISVLSGGCSGSVYNLEIINKLIKSDLNFKKSGINVSVDKKGMEKLDGVEIDFVDNLNESGFKFNNPNSKKECGCGKSFN
ncbi:iron-sulfur cluster assembly accessory protein [Candidatus Pacearchaeota archaeon]|nr:iron-sulfur cluster assembly accessory protein [Candidatus Pacearchaeota archaeon]